MAKGKKDWGENSKAVDARERKKDAKKTAQVHEARVKEDSYWEEAGEGAKTKAQAKRDELAKQREEAAQKKAEAKALAAAEDAEAAKKPKAAKVNLAPKVTANQLAQQKEAEMRQQAAASHEASRARQRTVTEDQYGQMVEGENLNRDDDTVEARSVTQAISALELDSPAAGDAHPERRMKAAYASFLDAEMPRLKLERPGLKLSQYKEIIWKSWQKSPSNPLNQQT